MVGSICARVPVVLILGVCYNYDEMLMGKKCLYALLRVKEQLSFIVEAQERCSFLPMICADRNNYKDGFKKHYQSFSNWNEAGSKNSRLLILCYCVECGLKYMIMEWEKISEVSRLRSDLQEKMKSHNIEELIQSCRLSGRYLFPPFNTVHNDIVTAGNYHQLCRYCVPYKASDIDKYSKYEEQLIKVLNVLKEKI